MPRCLGASRVGAYEGEDGVGGVGGGGPDLLAVEDEVVAVADGAGLEGGEVGAGAGLGVALGPGGFAGEDGRQVLAALLLAAVEDERWAQHARARSRRRAGRPRVAISWLRTNCSIALRPAPPYSFGQCGATQLRSARAACQSMAAARATGSIGLAVVLPGAFAEARRRAAMSR